MRAALSASSRESGGRVSDLALRHEARAHASAQLGSTYRVVDVQL